MILVWCLTNTAVKKSGLNNIQPVKITDKRRIDGAVSLLNAWVMCGHVGIVDAVPRADGEEAAVRPFPIGGLVCVLVLQVLHPFFREEILL